MTIVHSNIVNQTTTSATSPATSFISSLIIENINNNNYPNISSLSSTTKNLNNKYANNNNSSQNIDDKYLSNILYLLQTIDQQDNNYNYNHNKSYLNNSDSTNNSLEELIGPSRDSNYIVILMTIVYIAILITGVSGNMITCLVIARKRYLHTATNYYLFSLAVSDLLLLILGLPHDLVLLWQKYPYVFGEWFCILRGLSSELSTNASILTIIAFTIERYIAICHPIRSHTTLKLSRVIKTIIIIWIISALCALPIASEFGIVQVIDEEGKPFPGSDQCAVKHLIYEYIFEIATMVFFIIPICIITILYILIGIKLRVSSKDVNQRRLKAINDNHNNNTAVNNKAFRNNNNRFSIKKNNQLNTTSDDISHIKFSKTKNSNKLTIPYDSKVVNNSNINTVADGGGIVSSSISSMQTSSSPSSSSSSPISIINGNKNNGNDNQQQQQPQQSTPVTLTTMAPHSLHHSMSMSIRRQNASRRAVIKMLVAVVIAFFFCYSPFHAQRVMAIVMARNNVNDEYFIQIFTLLTHISGITYYLSSTINPILYQIMSKKFQLALRETLPCCFYIFCFFRHHRIRSNNNNNNEMINIHNQRNNTVRKSSGTSYTAGAAGLTMMPAGYSSHSKRHHPHYQQQQNELFREHGQKHGKCLESISNRLLLRTTTPTTNETNPPDDIDLSSSIYCNSSSLTSNR